MSANSNGFFLQAVFNFENCLRPLTQAAFVFCCSFWYPPAPYMGFGVIGAGRWQLRLRFAVVLQSGQDVFQFGF
jgi:hypothetical protein